MKKYRILLLLCFMPFCGLVSFKTVRHIIPANKVETKEAASTIIIGKQICQYFGKLNMTNLFAFDTASLSDSLPASARKNKASGWEILFDGKSTDKWRSKNGETFPSDGWVIENGSLVLNKKGAGDIITREKFSNFELDLDFNLTYGANSGVKYFVGEVKNEKTGKVSINGPEYQIIDDYNHPEVKDHKHDIAATASCYLLYVPKNVHLLPAGQWNHIRIIAKGKHVEHWLNGVKVLSYERGSADFLKRKSETKFRDDKIYGELASGHILLTDHGDKVYFRNIKIKRL